MNGYKITGLTINKPVTDPVMIGGLFGYTNGATINNVSLENVNVTGSSYTGGLVGVVDNAKISKTYATGSVEGTGRVGGLVGRAYDSSNIENSYWDKETTGQEKSALGEGKTTDEMKLKSTYVGWDFSSVWEMNEGTSYPTLR